MQLCCHMIGWLKKLWYYYWSKWALTASVRLWQWLFMVLHGLHVSDVSGYLTISAKALCRNITWESIPDSPFHFYFSSRQGESLGTRLIWSRKINNKKLAGIDLAKSLTLFKSDGVDPESAMNGYFSTSILATSLQNWPVGFSINPYIWVTRSLTISFLASGVNRCSWIQSITLGRHKSGISNLRSLSSNLLPRDAADGHRHCIMCWWSNWTQRIGRAQGTCCPWTI